MSTFAVFGMTRDVAMAEARKTVKTTRPDPKNVGQNTQLSVDDWLYKIGQRADQIVGGDITERVYRRVGAIAKPSK